MSYSHLILDQKSVFYAKFPSAAGYHGIINALDPLVLRPCLSAGLPLSM